MKKLLLILFLIFPGIIYSQSTESPPLPDEYKKGVMEVVGLWVDEMFKAESVSRLLEISDLPFTFDKEDVLTTIDELEAMYQSVFEDKGSRETPEYEIRILGYKRLVLERGIPLSYVNVLVEFKEHKAVIVSVLVRDESFKVIGFYD